MMVLSTVVATTGVLLNSSAVVVGSLVLAPLFGPAVSASVGTVIDESTLFWRGVKFQVAGIALAIAGASVFAWVLKTAYLLPSGFVLTAAPQVVARLSPDLLSLVVALVAGIAGIISIATAAGRALVGVMMAAALLPPAAIIGIGIAWTQPAVAIQSGILLLVNLLAINFAGLVTLWFLGYRPQSWIEIPRTRRALLVRGGVLFVAILITAAYLWNVTYAGARRTQLENAIEGDVEQLLDKEPYANVSLIGVRVEQDERSLAAPRESDRHHRPAAPRRLPWLAPDDRRERRRAFGREHHRRGPRGHSHEPVMPAVDRHRAVLPLSQLPRRDLPDDFEVILTCERASAVAASDRRERGATSPQFLSLAARFAGADCPLDSAGSR
jgi:uncharacterized hydrophobic protein (TIGR00271 family)